MTLRKLYAAGFTDLVSVVPPRAQLAPTTGLKRNTRGKAPGIRRIDGLWVGYPFTVADPPKPADIVKWERWGSNIGLRADHFPGLDVDVEHPQLAELVVKEALEFLGPAPVRTSREPRRLLVYRTEEPFSRISATIQFADAEHTVEMLCEGRQYLVMGRHPSGTDYGWEGEPLFNSTPGDLTTVSAIQVLEFFTHLAEKLQGRAEVIVSGTGDVKSRLAPPQEDLSAPDPEALNDVVNQIPNTYSDRDSYIRMGHAVKAAGGVDAFPLWWSWCERWEGGTNALDTAAADWKRMHPPYRVGWSWLQGLAADAGEYVPAQDAFEADVDAEIEVEAEGVADDSITGLIAYTDTWVVERLSKWLCERIRYVPETGHFHVWGSG